MSKDCEKLNSVCQPTYSKENLRMYPESNRSFEGNKILGGVGALLTAIGSLSLFSGSVGIIGIIGLILVLIAVKGFADEYRAYSMYRTALVGFFCGIIGTIGAIVVFAAFDFFGVIFSSHRVLGILGILGTIVVWIIVFVFLLGAGIFFKHTFDALAYRTRGGLLRTGALVLLIGAALTIVVVGFLLLFVAWLLIAIGLFAMRPIIQPAETITQPPPTYAQPPTGQVKYCPYCGAPNRLDGAFCVNCGRKLAT